MSTSRDRKEAAKRLGLALGVDYHRLLEASGEEEISDAAIKLGQTVNDNIEFICWCLKEFGGLQQMPFQRRPKSSALTGLGPN